MYIEDSSSVKDTELYTPVAITIISFAFWFASNVLLFQLGLLFLLAILILKNPINGVCFFLANEMMLGSAPPVIAGVSLAQLLGLLSIFACMALKKVNLKLISHPLSLFTILLTSYFAWSYYRYFSSIDVGIFNNLVFLFVILWAVNFRSVKSVRKVALTLIVSNFTLIIISIIYFIVAGADLRSGVFGNVRQIGFFGILAIPYIFMLSQQTRPRSKLLLFLRVHFCVIVLFNIITMSRLNIFIITVILISMTTLSLGIQLFSRKVVLLALIGLLFAIPTQGLLAKYIIRDTGVRVEQIIASHNLEDSALNAFTSGRSELYKHGLFMFSKYPILGAGYKSWGHITNYYNPFMARDGKERLSMHSTIIQYLAETGIVGLSMYITVLLILIATGYTATRTSEKQSIENSLGTVSLIVSTTMLLGGTLDNHSLAYRQLFLAIAFCIGLLASKASSSKKTTS